MSSLESAREYIYQLDLNYIIETMCAEHYPLPRWTKSDAIHCSELYKNFLWLLKKHHPLPLVPTKEIDEFWHNHILSTKNYMKDCEQIFGHYLHHDPASPDENEQALLDNFQITNQLYFEEFGKALV